MAKDAGSTGQLVYNANTYDIIEWEFTQEAEEIDVTDSGTAANAREYLAGRAGVTGRFRMFEEDNESNVITPGDSATISLRAKTGGSTDKKWEGTAVILSKNVVVPVAAAEAVVTEFTFRISGALTPTEYT